MGIGIDLYVPSLPDISSFYHTNIKYIEFSISLYLLGYGGGQSFLGLLSDAYGRRSILVFSSMFFIFSSILCAFSSTVIMLNVLRLIQGVAIAGLASGMRAIIVDLFQGIELKKMANYFALSWAVGPIVAPFIGANLSHHFGWQSNFYLLTIYGIVILCACLFLFSESNTNLTTFSRYIIFKNFIEIVTNHKFLLLSLAYGFSYSSVLVFNTVGPYLIESKLKYSILEYGYIAMILGCAYFLGTMVNRILITKYNNNLIMKYAAAVTVILPIFMIITAYNHLNLWLMFIPIFLIFFGIGLIVPNAIAITMEIFLTKAGFATSICGTIVGLIVSLATSLIGQFNVTGLFLSIWYFITFLLINLSIYLACRE